MNIVTTADSKFFHCLQGLAESVKKFYNKQLIVYDVGLTDEEKKSLDAIIIPIKVDVDFSGYAIFWKGEVPQATHKPFCVKHYFENYSEPMILVDADCLFMEKVEEYGFDVGVTLRREKRIDLRNPYTGIINTGVIFFNTYAKELINAWADGCQKENTTDQKELSEILSENIDWRHYNKVYDCHGLKIKVFNAEEYNDCRLKNGKIFHFKGKRHEKDMYEQLIRAHREGKDIYEMFKQLIGKQKKSWIKSISKRVVRRIEQSS